MRIARFECLAVLLAVALAPTLHAQSYDRPRLPRDADPNDWEAYFDFGVSKLQRDRSAATAAFTWAARLNPSRAEPLFAQWVSFWANDIPKFEKYLQDDKDVLRDIQVARAERWRSLALARNPFVHQGLVMVLYDALPGNFREDVATTGWLYFGRGDLPHAIERFGTAISRDARKYGYLRFIRASAFVNLSQNDSAAAELDLLLKQLRAEDEKTLGNGYQSKELLEYASGLLLLQKRQTAAAREAFGHAVLENASFAAAHAMLGNLALAARDTATALLEYGTAVQIDSSDVMLHIGYGTALTQSRRSAEAAEQFQRAVELEPYYAEARWLLASALESSGNKAKAIDAYRKFMDATTQADFRRNTAKDRIAALSSP